MIKTDTQIHNELANKTSILHRLTEEESQCLKQTLLSMLKDISTICKRHHLTYMLGGGSCLGAIRHNGFIPWDDDLDIMMPRRDYECFIALFKNSEFAEKYVLEAPSLGIDCLTPYLKVFKKDTLDVELINESTPFQKGIFIDVFPVDYAPKSKLMQFLHGLLSDTLQFISTCVLYAQYPSEKYLDYIRSSKEAFSRYKQRVLIGKVLGIISHRTWIKWFDKYNSNSKKTKYLTVPTGRKHYVGEIQPETVFLPTAETIFEGFHTYIPFDSDSYLSNLYGNYMQVPPAEKRERHFVYLFHC